MKNEIRKLMQENGIDAVVVSGAGDHNPYMVYISGGGHFKASVVQTGNNDPVIYCFPMEREEAARTGLQTRLHKNQKPGISDQAVELQWMLKEAGLEKGNVAFYGAVEASAFQPLMAEFSRIAPEYRVVSEMQETILMQARATKEESEIACIRNMGKVTTAVVGRVADMLTSSRVKSGYLLDPAGEPLRIGKVKQWINLWLAEAGAENPEGTIFAIGRDAGIPHSTGNADDLIELGKTIVFDIFPCENQGGYFYDFTRTWCLGHADDAIMILYTDVSDVYKSVVQALKPGGACKQYQALTCDLFKARGHPTISHDPGTTDGYVHSLGHGLGLNVHEAPWFSASVATDSYLLPGSVFTIEPGLYYPERGMGVRLEDTYLCKADGTFEKLAEFPMDLVLPVRKG